MIAQVSVEWHWRICVYGGEPATITLQWRQNERDCVSNLPASRSFIEPFIQMQIKENTKAPHHWPLCGEFPTQRASNAETVSIWWRHHETTIKHNKAWTFSTAIYNPSLVDASISSDYEIWLGRLASVSIDFGGCLQLQWNLDTFAMHFGLTWQTGIHTGFQWPLTAPCGETIWWRHQMEAFSALLCGEFTALCGEFTGNLWIPHTKASDAELGCFLWSAPE